MASFGPISAITMRIAEDPTSMTPMGSDMELVPGALGGAHHDRIILQFGGDHLDVSRRRSDGTLPHGVFRFPQDDAAHGLNNPAPQNDHVRVDDVDKISHHLADKA